MAAPATLPGRASDSAAVSRRSTGGDSDRRRAPIVRRRFSDRRDHADAHVPSRRLPSAQSDSCARETVGDARLGRRAARTSRSTRPRWRSATASSTIRAIACSRCGTWPGTAASPAWRRRATASRGRNRPSTSSPARTSSTRTDAIRPPYGSICSTPIRASDTRCRRGSTRRFASTSRRTACTGRRSARPGRPAIARPASSTRSGASGCSAFATRCTTRRSAGATAAIGRRASLRRRATGTAARRSRGPRPTRPISRGPACRRCRSCTTWIASPTRA